MLASMQGQQLLGYRCANAKHTYPSRRYAVRVTCDDPKYKGRLTRYSKVMTRSDGYNHLGSALKTRNTAPFPGPPPNDGPPLRVLPVGGLGEIGMNCMLVGVRDSVTDLGMQKILPDVSFLAKWRDKIEAVIITHGHEDHIGAMPWVVPALDPETPIFAAGFSMQLIKRRMQEFNIWSEERFHTFSMRTQFNAGPFSVEPFRVTHSIPDCCGLVLRGEAGTIVHTGDWKIDETPVDGEMFDRPFFEQLGQEGVTLFMSDSTNVLTPGRTTSEITVQQSILEKVMAHQGKGRIIATQFASNIHRLVGMKQAADASGRKIAFIGTSLFTYLEAAWRDGRAPFDPRTVIQPNEVEDYDPNELLVITTGSQAEPRAALSLAAREASNLLKLQPSDLLLYSAKVIPGNETRVMSMMNNVAAMGTRIVMGRNDNLHTSGHAYQGELEEVLKLVKPQHFLPVHGEYAFLCRHAELAQDLGVQDTSVIRNGQLLGVYDKRNAKTVSSGSMSVIGEAKLQLFYNDGHKGTGTADEMALEERSKLAVDGIVVASIDVIRVTGSMEQVTRQLTEEEQRRARLKARIRVTTRGMWTDNGRLLERLHRGIETVIAGLPYEASLVAVERYACETMRKVVRQYNSKYPEVIAIVHEMDPRAGMAATGSNGRGRGRDGPMRDGNPRGGAFGRGPRREDSARGGRLARGSVQDKIMGRTKNNSFRTQQGGWPEPRGNDTKLSAQRGSHAANDTKLSAQRGSHAASAQRMNRMLEVMPAISYDDNESNLLDPAADESDGEAAEGSGKAAPETSAKGNGLNTGERKRLLKTLKKPALVKLAQQLGLPEGRAEDMRTALLPHAKPEWFE